MGLIRKAASLSTLGGVKYTSKREAQTKAAAAQGKLARAETKLARNQGRAATAAQQQARREASDAKWQPVLAAIEAGEASWDDLGRLQKLSMPLGYQLRCKAASRRQGGGA